MRIYRSIKQVIVLALVVGVGLLGMLVATAQTDASEVIEIGFVNHIQAGLTEQDVYLITEDGMGKRVEGSDPLSSVNQMHYGAAAMHEHDPFGVNEEPVGPFEIGESLGVTLSQWLGATGSGTYTVNGDVAQVSLTFEGLMLDGVYTLWCSQIVLPPDFEILNTPCGAPDGSENVFEADADGNAHIDLEIAARPYTTEEILSVFAIAYHSNGQTYGEYPGDFSLNSHVQLFVPLPSAEG